MEHKMVVCIQAPSHFCLCDLVMFLHLPGPLFHHLKNKYGNKTNFMGLF